MDAASSDPAALLVTRSTCAPCRKAKKKCDGGTPCERCVARRVRCHLPVPVVRRQRTDSQTQGRSVESLLASLSNAHDRELLPLSLVEKIRSATLTNISEWCPKACMDIPTFPFLYSPIPLNTGGAPLGGDVHAEETDVGYRPVESRATIELMWNGQDPESVMSSVRNRLFIIRTFLPFRLHCNFFMDIPTFLSALARPPDDPASIHPALLNAIYSVSCCLISGTMFTRREYFFRETWRQLNLSLQNADRLTHFLWASVVFGSYFTNTGRLVEAYAVISACARFAIACGLDGITDINRSSTPQYPLLPPPANEVEAEDRIQLSRAIYMADRALSMLSGFPSTYRTPRLLIGRSSPSIFPWGEPSYRDDADIRNALTAEQSLTSSSQVFYDGLFGIIGGDSALDVKSMQLYERVERFALQTKGNMLPRMAQAEFQALEAVFKVFHRMLPSLLDSRGLAQFEVFSLVNPHLLIAHTTYHGCLLLLHSLTAEKDARSRAQQFEAARSLASLFSQIRGSRGLRRVRAIPLPTIHAMNATRFFTSYLKTVEVQKDNRTIAVCYQSLAALADYLLEVYNLFPRWTQIVNTLKDLVLEDPSLPTSVS